MTCVVHMACVIPLPCMVHMHACQRGFDFEDVRWDAPWTQTRGEETGVKPNCPMQAIPKSRDFPESFFRPDPFHNGKLGVGQDWVAGCVLHLADMKMFADAGYDPQMAIATDMFRDFCRRNKFSPTFKAFTQESFLVLKNGNLFPRDSPKNINC